MDNCFQMPATTELNRSRQGERIELDLLGSGSSQPASAGDGRRPQGDRGLPSSQDLLPDLIGASQQQQQASVPPPLSNPNHSLPPDIQPSSSNPLSHPPDIAPLLSSRPPDLAANSQTPLDLLNPQAGMAPGLLQLSEGIARDSSQTISKFARGTPDVAGQW